MKIFIIIFFFLIKNRANFFLAFYFLAGSVKNNSAPEKKVECINNNKTDIIHGGQNLTGISFIDDYGGELFFVMEMIYLYAIICIFICSLGNRPQGSRILYLACIILFAIIMGFLLILTGITIYQVISANIDNGFSAIFENEAISGMVLSLISTYGIYFIASFLHLQPAHMFTSFIQYLLLLPSFVNILMVYAFCNTHDVSWGTKGSTEDSTSKLGSVKAKPGESIQVELPSKEDVNSHYEKLLPELKRGPPVEEAKVDLNSKIQDNKQNFRTYMVLFWIFCNSILLVVAVTVFDEEYLICSQNFNPYLTFIFYCVVFLSTIRFIGSTIYLIGEIF